MSPGLWVIAGVAAVMFAAGFMEPDKVKSPAENRAMTAALYLVGVLLFLPNRAGAVVRRAVRSIKKV